MSSSRFSRRNFLRTSLIATGGVTLAACAPVGAPAGTTASQPSQDASAPRTEVQFLNECVGSKEEGRTYLLAAFNAANDQIHVNHEGYGGADTVHQKFLTALSGGIVPDLYHNEANYIPGYAEMDALTDLGPYLDASTRIDKNDILPHPLELCTYDGKIYGIPFWQDAVQLYYNKDLMQQAGLNPEEPPRDWDSFRSAAEAITKRDSDGTLLVAGMALDSWSIIRVFQAALYSWGGMLLSPDGTKSAFNSDEGEAALQTLVDLILKDKLGEVGWGSEFEDSPNEPFIAGKQGFMFDVPAAAKRIQRNRPEFQSWGTVGLPAGPKGFAEVSRPPALMIPKSAKNKDQAWRTIEYWLDTKVMLRWALDILRAPTTVSASSDEALANNKVVASLVESLKNTVDTPKTKHWAQLFDTLGAELELALGGQKTPRQALDDAAATLDPALTS